MGSASKVSRRTFIVAAHAGLAVVANFLAFWLRFDGEIPRQYWDMWTQTIPWLLGIRVLTFRLLHLYDGMWQYVGVRDLRSMVIGALSSTAVFYVLIRGVLRLPAYPLSVFFVDCMLLVVLLVGLRVAWRLWREHRPSTRTRRVLIYGAGDAGEMILREMLNGGDRERLPVGFVDDDPTKIGRRIHGVPVLGTRQDLARIIVDANPAEVLMAMPRAASEVLRAIVKELEPYKLPIKTVPRLRDILDGRVTLSQVQDLRVEDLLGRTPVGLDMEAAKKLIKGRRILVTGAGGSIGSELCKQVLALEPFSLVLFERNENALWAVERSLAPRKGDADLYPIIADATDAGRVADVLREHRPHVVFHAAAHKHVPLMELNPCEAIKNNVKGTRIVSQAAIRHGVERFVLISSDKAVNPSSVMGATKRAAELLTMALAKRASTTCLIVVRFGNVIGSNGSVIPLFLDQIRSGGPVTVTDPEVRRYFMLIPEAVQLVLQAAAFGENGAGYVLDMGPQLKVVDMARNLIRLSGFIPDVEIPITYIGLRPGEKLSEELVASDEAIEASGVAGVHRVRGAETPDYATLEKTLIVLEVRAEQGESKAVLQELGTLVPTFRASSDWKSVVRADLRIPPVAVPARTIPQPSPARGAA
jgi:FlaA1/EpsC-like NDP-sugar epimerase